MNKTVCNRECEDLIHNCVVEGKVYHCEVDKNFIVLVVFAFLFLVEIGLFTYYVCREVRKTKARAEPVQAREHKSDLETEATQTDGADGVECQLGPKMDAVAVHIPSDEHSQEPADPRPPSARRPFFISGPRRPKPPPAPPKPPPRPTKAKARHKPVAARAPTAAQDSATQRSQRTDSVSITTGTTGTNQDSLTQPLSRSLASAVSSGPESLASSVAASSAAPSAYAPSDIGP